MYELTDSQMKAVAGGLQPPVREIGPTTYRTEGGTLSSTAIYSVDQGGIVKNALAGIGEASMYGAMSTEPDAGAAFDMGSAMGYGVVNGVTYVAKVSVGPLTQVRSDGYDTESGGKVK